ncbi:MAG TPA: PA14 domain-containing protein, partial [Planctomycetota bacterium]|nr:PA14 domain-containing protein [Planctomycetota bacterium]
MLASISVLALVGSGGSSALAQTPPQSPQARRGLQLSFEPADPERRQKEGAHSQLARLLSLRVDRGDAPTPMLAPGMFRARFTGTVSVPIRDRYRFRAFGQGSIKLTVNGELVLEGELRDGKPLETAQPARLKKGDNQLVCELDSTAFGEATLRVHWSGPEFGYEPIAPETWQVVPDEALLQGEREQLGHQLLVERRCVRCHEPVQPRGDSAFGELDRAGADLRRAGERLRVDWLQQWIDNPRAVRPDARMPRLQLREGTAADVAAYLASRGAPLPEPAFTRDQVAAGAQRFREFGCIACHVPPAESKTTAALGDRLWLGFVPAKWHGAALVEFLREPARDNPHVRMPDFKLPLDEATALAAYLLDGRPAWSGKAQGSADKGKRAVARSGCIRCHQFEVDDLSVYARLPELQLREGRDGCLGPPKGAVPDHGLTDAERAALRAFLPHATSAAWRRSPIDFAEREIRTHRCTACHARDGDPSVWAQVAAELGATEPLPPEQDPLAQGVPALTWVGAKLQPSWLERFVTGKEKSPRPWLHARMPAFAAHGGAITAGLVKEHGYPPQDEPDVGGDAALAVFGQKLIKMGDGFGCVQCHALGGQPAVQAFERQGINFMFAAQRLRKEFYTRWL